LRADKFLSNSGLGSRKEIKALIKSGAVLIDGNSLKDASVQIDENNDIVTVNGEEIVFKEFIYLMLNKPQGYVSAVFDKKLPVVTELVPEKYAHYEVFPVGRLDIDTEGLLILTNDGALTHRLLSPKKHVDKTYYIISEHQPDEKTKELFNEGIVLDDGYKTMSAKLEILSEEKESLLTIQEGKFHQVKRMFEAAGNKVNYLKRVKMGALSLDESLKKGEVRELTDEEVKLLEKRDI